MVSVWEDAMDSHQLPVLPGMPGYDHGYLTSASRKSRDGDDLAARSGVYEYAARRHIEMNWLSHWLFRRFTWRRSRVRISTDSSLLTQVRNSQNMLFLRVDDHFQTPIPVSGSQEKTFSRFLQGKHMGDHIGYIHSFILNPFQGR